MNRFTRGRKRHAEEEALTGDSTTNRPVKVTRPGNEEGADTAAAMSNQTSSVNEVACYQCPFSTPASFLPQIGGASDTCDVSRRTFVFPGKGHAPE